MNPLTPERFMIDDALIEKDYDTLRRLTPECAKMMADMIEDACDRLEYEGSFLYDECPDKTTLLTITDKICEKMEETTAPTIKDFVQMMLCDEILYRRCRYYRKKKMFE